MIGARTFLFAAITVAMLAPAAAPAQTSSSQGSEASRLTACRKTVADRIRTNTDMESSERPACFDVASSRLSPGGRRCFVMIERAISETELATVLAKNRGSDASASPHRERANQFLGQADQCIASLPAGGAESPRRAGAPPGSRHVITERDLPALAAKQHPGQEWGYLRVYMNADDTVGDTLTVKVPNTAANGALIDVPVSSGAMNAATHDLWTAVRGYVRRGQGRDGIDVLEVTGVHHRAHHGLRGDLEVDGWRAVHQTIALVH